MQPHRQVYDQSAGTRDLVKTYVEYFTLIVYDYDFSNISQNSMESDTQGLEGSVGTTNRS